MLIGPPAAGKTTMMAKLAARGCAPLATVFSTDGDRPGGIEQLADPLNILGIEPERLDVVEGAVPYSEGRRGALLVDTDGTDAAHGFAALGHLAERLGVEPVLVLPATIDAGEARQFAEAALAIGGGSVTPNFAYGLKPIGPESLANHLLTLAQRERF